MNRQSRIYVAGHGGMVGSAIMRALSSAGYTNVVVRARADLDLTNQAAVARFFELEKPDYVILAAAKVGGILANSRHPATFGYTNQVIQTNVIYECWKHAVKRLLFLGSSCIYPRDCPQPIDESYLLTGPLEETNRAYAVAKIAGVELCASFNRQYGTEYIAAMPTNLYGPNDNFDLETSHVLPALIRKFHEAKLGDMQKVTLWGSGAPRREFMHSDDLAKNCLVLLGADSADLRTVTHDLTRPLINIGTGEDLTIRELAELVAEVVGFNGVIEWDRTKPDGTPRKLLNVSKLKALGGGAAISLKAGISSVYEAFRQSDAEAGSG